uniref:SAP domain-containing protein n=1 Tax=Astyanax mexicanus TaxID=7994 RepID=A0A8B9GUW9_ASTMX
MTCQSIKGPIILFCVLQVAELKHQLKIRALPVSGTKNDLIERLRTFHEQNECTVPSSTTEGTSEPAASTTNTPQTSQPPPHLPQTVQSQTSTTILHQPGNSRVLVSALPFVAAVGMCRPPPPSADHSQIVQFGSCSPSSPLSPSHSEHSLAGRSPDGHSSKATLLKYRAGAVLALAAYCSANSSPFRGEYIGL